MNAGEVSQGGFDVACFTMSVAPGVIGGSVLRILFDEAGVIGKRCLGIILLGEDMCATAVGAGERRVEFNRG